MFGRKVAATQRFSLRAALSLAAVAALAACSGPGADVVGTTQSPVAAGELESVAVVTHGSAGDAFWNVVKNGAEAAGKELGVAVQYNSSGDPGQQAKLIDNAVAQGVDGLVVSMANPEALRPSVERAVAAGIPVVTINSGESESAKYGAFAHVGQSEGLAGQAAGRRLADAGRTKLLCVIHEAGNIGANQRCDGATRAFGNGATLQVDINNPTDAQSRIKGALEADRSIDAVLTLNSQVAARAVDAVRESRSAATVATFDLNTDVVEAIRAGALLFAVDQQQYEQGYLPIVLLQLYRTNLNTVGGGAPVQTGPGFVDADNVEAVATLVAQGTR
ncbi:simple sugar transport system substrate-binding protein [Nocardia amikacinitolerans]|uniref:Simple sugar transport system substrate-binding protein n=1 Tax=Nocardia amikacinitolerans TaxID=756689 RepID=A0A285LWE6_9NOCA|nr:sugar ABC transporter substrate-binding protein [Nocardia amikacinitolerans]MCP2280761.1 simple sugar transport system substrate-binding protein [Nocardia amikacinitolerans]MCP2297272.1 simple sugar transport system substrate-binding protein [Nocardia amikacinitolerans]SNY88467.1 simple sugar transport system substrate-binding protein [Nocardia amikacinitolerans]